MTPARFPHLVILGALAFPGAGLAQTSKLIEVASVKPSSDTGADPNLNSLRTSLIATNVTVGYLIRFAYAVKDHQVERIPGWVDTVGYDVAVKHASSKSTGLEEEQAVVRELLADRFQLTTHRETRQMPVYLLVVGNNGPKLTAHNDGTGVQTRKRCGHLSGARVTVDVIATILSRQFEREVLNRTELPGKYDFQLDWMPDSGPCPGAAEQPSIFTAVEQQLGLKLEASKGPVDVLVIDRVERPSGN